MTISSGEAPMEIGLPEQMQAESTTTSDLSSFDRAIGDLQSRIVELRDSVAELGHAGDYEPPPAYQPPPAAYASPPAPPPHAYQPPPAAYAPRPEDGQAERSDPLASLSRVDVGPFHDLIAMTAFEEQLSALPTLADVRVRRFAAHRAEIEIEPVPGAVAAREVLRIAPEAEAVTQADGTVAIELRSPRWTAPAAALGDAASPPLDEAAGSADSADSAESRPSADG